MALKQTPSQTLGPFFAYGLTPQQYGYRALTSIASATLAGPQTEGERIRVVGRVLDGEGAPADDAMVEIWQADGAGRYAHDADGRASNSSFGGFGRAGTGTDPECRFIFDTIKPGAPSEHEAPHINIVVFIRGLLSHVYTRMYFADEHARNAQDPVLSGVPSERRSTLLAERSVTEQGMVYVFDIRMQGEHETVFFDL